MKIYIAEEAGFCFGVKRALKIINQLNEKRQEIQIYGQLIHNRTVLDQLEAKGIDTIDTLDQWTPQKTLVIRTHGIPKQEEEKLKEQGIGYVDATCPLVKKLHRIIGKLNKKKAQIVIIGNKNHPEIIAAKSYANNAVVINSRAEAQKIKKTDSLSVIAQTTLDTDHFEEIVSYLAGKAEKLDVYNTICNATITRQQALKKLAPEVDFVVVVGGKNSSNTRKLYHIALKRNKNTYYIEQSSDLNRTDFIKQIKDFQSAGVTAGASTPPEEIKKVKNILKNIKKNYNINIEKEKKNGKRE
jgi:4-hydroxy-3-methylbut-2-enyl diphosphate reductase